MDRNLLHTVSTTALMPALGLLPQFMRSEAAVAFLLAVGLQESRLTYRRQTLNGPARGLWQFERGTEASRGGVWGVYLHKASREHLRRLCLSRQVPFLPEAIYAQLEHDDILAAGVARLLLWTDAAPLPDRSDAEAAWKLYALRTWRPGKPHRSTWNAYYADAWSFVLLGDG